MFAISMFYLYNQKQICIIKTKRTLLDKRPFLQVPTPMLGVWGLSTSPAQGGLTSSLSSGPAYWAKWVENHSPSCSCTAVPPHFCSHIEFVEQA